MSKQQGARPLVMALLLFLALAWPSGTARAMTLYVYELDSLVYLSTDVVEGEIIRSYEAHKQDLIDLKVTFVHKGAFKKGQTIVVAESWFYRKPKKNDWNPQPLAVRDRLVFFGQRVKANEFFRIPKDAVIHAPLPGGLRLVQGDHIFGFAQRDNPGPYVANISFEPVQKGLLTVARFREQIHNSLGTTQELARLVEAKQDKLDMPRLLKVLAARSQQTWDGRDYFTERICIRFAESQNPHLLSRALPLAKEHHEISILQRGFGTPKGRDYLLAKVTDASEPMAARLRYAYTVYNAGAVFRSTFTEISANSWRPVGEADEGNSGYLTRLARAARATRQHEELCRRLIHCLDYFGQGIVQNKPAPLLADLLGAFAVLKEFYDGKPSQELQFTIEKATAWDHNAYDKLKSPCGSFISILRAVDPDKYTKPEKRSLIFEYDYTTVLLKQDAKIRPSVVLVHQGTQKRFVFPSQVQIRGWSTGGGSDSVELPKDLPAGRYHVFYQVTEGDKLISTGHYFAADL